MTADKLNVCLGAIIINLTQLVDNPIAFITDGHQREALTTSGG